MEQNSSCIQAMQADLLKQKSIVANKLEQFEVLEWRKQLPEITEEELAHKTQVSVLSNASLTNERNKGTSPKKLDGCLLWWNNSKRLWGLCTDKEVWALESEVSSTHPSWVPGTITAR